LVSVVIGSYNAEAWIGQALDSVLAQTHPVLEVLVIDDGSTDQTAAIVQSYSRRVRFLADEHRGRPHRNRGIAAARGEFVAFVDADDFWHESKVEKQIGLLHAQNTAWAVCDSLWLDSATGNLDNPIGEPVRGGDILEDLFLNNFIVASTPIVSKHALEQVGLFDETPAIAPVEDWDLWLRLAARYPVACVAEKLVTLRLHPDSFLAATPIAARVQALENVIARAAAREPARLRRLRKRALHNVYHAAGVQLFRQENLAGARHYFLGAWRQRPTRMETIAYLALTTLGRGISAGAVGLRRRSGRRR
jgi:hypothetical protein